MIKWAATLALLSQFYLPGNTLNVKVGESVHEKYCSSCHVVEDSYLVKIVEEDDLMNSLTRFRRYFKPDDLWKYGMANSLIGIGYNNLRQLEHYYIQTNNLRKK